MLKIVFLLAVIIMGVLGYKWYSDSKLVTVKHIISKKNNTAKILNVRASEDIAALKKVEIKTQVHESKKIDTNHKKKINMHSEVDIDSKTDTDMESENKVGTSIDITQDIQSVDKEIPIEVLTHKEIEVQIEKDRDLLLELEKNEGI